MIGIYLIRNKINNKVYVGQSINIEKRWRDHKVRKDDSAIHQAIQKYGVENFEFKVLQECTRDELNDLEVFYIEKYKSFGKNGYNLNKGGNSCPKDFTKTRIERIKSSCKGRKSPMKGKHLSEETKKHLSEVNKGKKASEETKLKLSINSKNAWKNMSENNYKKRCENISKSLKGRKISDEQKEKIKKTLTGKKQSDYTKKKKSETINKHLYQDKVYCETDNKIFSSCKECSDFYKVSCYKILSAIRNNTELNGRKFKWVI